MRQKIDIDEIQNKAFLNKQEIKNGNHNNGEWKTLNERIKQLVDTLENSQKLNNKMHSARFFFSRGIVQGLGFVIGSTVVAGLMYYFFITYLGLDFLKDWTLENVSSN